MDSVNGKAEQHNAMSATLDLTFLIDEDFEPPPELGPSGAASSSYTDDIPSGRVEYKLFPDKIMADIMKECPCRISCAEKLMKDPHIVQRIQHIRSEYFFIPQGNKRTTTTVSWIRNSLREDHIGQRQHSFEGTNICRHKWIDIMGISVATYYRALQYVKENVYGVETVRKRHCSNVRGNEACGFIANCLNKYGDHNPEKQKVVLPPCVNRKFIYDEYLEDQGPHIKIKHFYQLFKKNFSGNVSFAKNGNINPCDICLKANNELHKMQDEVQKQTLRSDLKIHLDRQSDERQDYYRKKREAITKPKEAMSVIIDGMDQGKTSIPHFRGWCRAKSSVPAIKTHITGTMVHGEKNYFFVDLNQWPHDPNLTITCLIKAICQAEAFPPKLYLQCDNCGRENKNKFVLGFLAFLCHAGYFKEIFLSFLLKGHTHEDIDQQFSKISHHLKGVNAMTLPQLTNEIKKSFTTQPHVETLGTIWDIKSWIGEYLTDIHNHSFPHQFWLFCDRPSHVTLKVRMWSTDQWTPCADDPPLELFKLSLDGEQILPTGIPGTCLPNFEKMNTQQARQVIEKSKIHLSFDEYKWWDDFLKNPQPANVAVWPLQNMPKLHRIEDIPMDLSLPGIQTESCIASLLQAEQTVREVITTQRGRKRRQETNQ